MTTQTMPSAHELLAKIRADVGCVPAAIEKSFVVDDGLIQEPMRARHDHQMIGDAVVGVQK
ncbi:MAG: hypothetical protein M0T84_12125 [Betaproteobacteria bacterium]|nr:hypothetical protein [Betaproteobacteria bacterium]